MITQRVWPCPELPLGGVTSSLLDTKLYAPRRPKGLVSRPNLTDRVQRGTQSKLTLVSAPAGVRQVDPPGRMAGCRADRRIGHRVALARSRRQPSGHILDARDRRLADGGAHGRREGADAPRIARPVHRSRPRSPAQRAQRGAPRPRAGPRRLPHDRFARNPGRHGVSARASARAGAPRDCDSRRSRAAACPSPCARRPDRDPRDLRRTRPARSSTG
jgi:hypothetical protein